MALPKGYSVGSVSAGFRKPARDDVAVLVSELPCVVAGVFTTNAFKAAPVLECQRILGSGASAVQAVLVNSGQANACTGDEGLENCISTTKMMADVLGLGQDSVLPMSTGVIGAQFRMDLWEEAVPKLKDKLGSGDEESFTRAMMTTDAFPKFFSREVEFSGGLVRFAGMAKGAGMICPNMATMLALVVCDAAVEREVWQKLFVQAVDNTFNRVTVDGDTSTNDTVLGLANGASGVSFISSDIEKLKDVLEEMLGALAYMLVQDGEGSTKVIKIEITGAKDDADAEKVARTVGHSQLVKTAMYGRDANWGRIVAAVGRSGADFLAQDVRVFLCGIELFCNGQPVDGDHDAALEGPLKERDIHVLIELGAGDGKYTLLASDLSHDYVSCNADYRT